jgi:hypothetical protein
MPDRIIEETAEQVSRTDTPDEPVDEPDTGQPEEPETFPRTEMIPASTWSRAP